MRAICLSSRRRRPLGLTLLELMIGMVIMGIALRFVLINVDSLTPRARIEKSGRDFGTTFVFARDFAITHGREVTINIDLDDQRYVVSIPELDEFDRETKETFDSELSKLEKGVKIEGVYVGEERKTSSGEVAVKINSSGVMSGIVLLLSMEDQHLEFSVRINPITGLVQFYPEHVEGGFVKDSVLGGGS